jgi:chromosome segregation ATPase
MIALKKRRSDNIDCLREIENNIESNNINYEKLLSELNGMTMNNNNLLLELNESNNSNNKLLLLELFKKINSLEKKVDELNKINLKMDTLQKSIDKILVEKDYTIENLNDQINELKSEIREKNYTVEDNSNKKINDYFY